MAGIGIAAVRFLIAPPSSLWLRLFIVIHRAIVVLGVFVHPAYIETAVRAVVTASGTQRLRASRHCTEVLVVAFVLFMVPRKAIEVLEVAVHE